MENDTYYDIDAFKDRFSSDNPFTIVNILIVLVAIMLFIKFFPKKLFWMGVLAMVLLGMWFYAGKKGIRAGSEDAFFVESKNKMNTAS